MSYAGLGSAASAKRYWNRYAKACQGMADEGACLNRAIQHGANVTFSASGLGQTAPSATAVTTQQALAIAGLGQTTASTVASVADTTARLISDPEGTMRRQGPQIVAALDRHVVNPLVDRMAVAAAPYMVRYILPPLAVLYVLSGLSAFYSFQGLKILTEGKPVRSNRRRR